LNDYKKLYSKLEFHLNCYFKTKVYLKYDTEDQYFKSLNTITINKSNSWKHRFYALTHELGHVIIDTNETEKYYSYPSSKYKSSRYSRKDAISTITEEYDAWNYGRKYIQQSLNVVIDKDYFDNLKTNCLMSYVVDSLERVYGKQININYIKSTV
jgi:hypothetical protein